MKHSAKVKAAESSTIPKLREEYEQFYSMYDKYKSIGYKNIQNDFILDMLDNHGYVAPFGD